MRKKDMHGAFSSGDFEEDIYILCELTWRYHERGHACPALGS